MLCAPEPRNEWQWPTSVLQASFWSWPHQSFPRSFCCWLAWAALHVPSQVSCITHTLLAAAHNTCLAIMLPSRDQLSLACHRTLHFLCARCCSASKHCPNHVNFRRVIPCNTSICAQEEASAQGLACLLHYKTDTHGLPSDSCRMHTVWQLTS